MAKGLLIVLVLAACAAAGCGGDSTTSSGNWAPFRIPAPKQSPHRYEKELQTNAAGLMGRELKPAIPSGPPPVFLAEAFLIEGIGLFAEPGDELTVQYVGVNYETEEKFASSWEEGKPFTFRLGRGEVIEGWEEALANGEVGDRVELVVPPDLTDGPFPRNIPEDSAAIFVIELLAVH